MNQKEFIVEQKVEGKNKSDLKNGVQQVFVLPPNLLKKLGIHLGDVGSTHTQGVCDLEQTKSNETKVETNLCNISSHVSKAASCGSYDEPSIIKTASLMKQSVFLSPTFSSSGIFNCTVSTKHNVEESNEKCNTNIIENNYAHNLELLASTSEQKQNPKEEVNNKLSEKIKANINDENVCIKDKYIQLNHEPEGVIKPSLLNDTNNSVNIISEEIISLSKLNELKACIPSKKDLVPASLNTVIVKKVRNNTIPQTVILSNSNELNSTIQLSKPKAALNINNEINNETVIATKICLTENHELKETLSDKCLLSEAKKLTDSEKNNSYKPETKQNTSSQLEPKNKNVKKDSELLFANELDTEIDNENEFKSKSDINCYKSTVIPVTLTDIEVERKNCVWNKTDIRNSEIIVKPLRLQKDNTIVKLNNNQECKNEAFNKVSKAKENAVVELENPSVHCNTLPDKINTNTNSFDTIEPSKKRVKTISSTHLDFDHLSSVTRNLKSENALSEGLISDTPNIPKIIEGIRVCQQSSQNDKIICDSVNNNIADEGVLGKHMIKSAKTYVDKRQLKSVEIKKIAIMENDPKSNHKDKENVIILTKSPSTLPNVGCVNIIKNRFGSNELEKEVLKCSVQPDIVIDSPEVNGKECTLDALILPHDNMINMAEDCEDITNAMNLDNDQEFLTQQMTKNANDLVNDFTLGQKSELPYADNDQDVNNELKLTSSSERNIFISKLCIQGVEKPGGVNLKENKNKIKIRTYSNNRKNKIGGHSGSCIDNVIKFKGNFENTSINLLPNASASLTYNQNFCICEDFGILDCDLLNNTYEHVHFLERRLQDCTSDIIFSMYIDDETVNYKDPVENFSYVHDSYNEIDIDIDYICWNNANLIQNSFSPSYKEKALEDLIDTQIKKSEFDIAKVHLNSTNHSSSSVTIVELNTEDDVKRNPNNNEHLSPHIEVDISDNLQTESRKRKISDYKDNDDEVPKSKKLEISVKCSVCEEEIAETQLEDHIAHHGFMYVKENKNDEIDSGNNNIQIDVNSMTEIGKPIKCGVCKIDVISSGWLTHIATTHNYIAWKDGEKPINLKEEDDVKDHLQRTIQELGQLVCSTCGLAWKYAKPYLHHIKRCCGVSNDFNTSLVLKKKLVECAVCHTKVDNSVWTEHIAKQHNYLAWKANEAAVDFNDNKQLRKHFGKILSDVRTLVCAKCGVERQYAKAFISHLESCTENFKIPNSKLDESIVNVKDADTSENNMEIVKCGVCEEEMASEQWVAHIKDQHNYKAWKHGETPLDFERETTLRNHLYRIVQLYGPLECTKCGKTRKYVKMYLQHIETCTGPDLNETVTAYEDLDSLMDIPSAGDTVMDSTKPVTCGVCQSEMKAEEWLEHIQNKHNYLAWQVGRKPLDLKDKQLVRSYLYDVAQKLGALVCGKCGISRKYVKMYLQHVETCTGSKDLNETATAYDDLDSIMDIPSAGDTVMDSTKPVTCGVCQSEMKAEKWLEHIQNKHNYLAWQVGRKPLDLKDKQLVRSYLYDVAQKLGALVCGKCGISRKYVKMYLQHVETCTGPKDLNETATAYDDLDSIMDIPSAGDTVMDSTKPVTCGVCQSEMKAEEWLEHIQNKHNYLAWQVGRKPLDLKDEQLVRSYLYDVAQKLGALVCGKCGISRKYVKMYLQHVETCTGSKDLNETATAYDYLDSIMDLPSAGDTVMDSTKPVTCGVCQSEMKAEEWLEHIQNNHNYLAWQVGRKPLDLKDEQLVRSFLYDVVHKLGALVCGKCGISRKYVKMYLQHVETCTGPKEVLMNNANTSPLRNIGQCTDLNNSGDVSSVDAANFSVLDDANLNTLSNDGSDQQSGEDAGGSMLKCAVCKQEVASAAWMAHIRKEHNYQAWQDGEDPVNLQDEEAVKQFLNNIMQKVGHLACAKCGASHKDVELYLQHVSTCTKTEEVIKCGVCSKEMNKSSWIQHISLNHEYIAWKETETPLDINNYEAVWQHLMKIIKEVGCLRCSECGLKRKYPKSYLLHVKACYGKTYVISDGGNSSLNESCISNVNASMDTTINEDDGDGTRVVKCAVCSEEMEVRLWLEHIQKLHAYVAWQEGSTPIDLEDEQSIIEHLRGIERKYGALVCARCGIVRRKVATFYRHTNTCNGPEPENESLMSKSEHQWANPCGETVKCAVCQSEMSDSEWMSHIANDHDYLAWREGETPLNMNDDASVREHLNMIFQFNEKFICSKCGEGRKYVKSYLQHLKTCGTEETENDSMKEVASKELSGVTIKCGICQLAMDSTLWLDHIQEHNYVAWKENEQPLVFENEEAVKDYLYTHVLQKIDQLTCKKCGLARKYAKVFLQHIEQCQKITWQTISTSTVKVKKERGDIVKCAVCQEQLDDVDWISHISEKHGYLAWRDRDAPVDLEDEDAVRNHLKDIIQEEGYLQCNKCGVQRKYAKVFLQHVKTCGSMIKENDEEEGSLCESSVLDDTDHSDANTIVCGVCKQDVLKGQWIEHIQKEHKYLAWQEGKKPIDTNDNEAVYNYLHAMSNKYNGLVCGMCGIVRKYVKPYLTHVNSCTAKNYASYGTLECGVCGEKVEGKSWRNHAIQKHYNIAWVVGETPIDIRSFPAVDKCLREYNEYKHKMVCNICGTSRTSNAGFHAHILTCGKSDEEVENLKQLCEICNQKFLCIYLTQHYRTHITQEMALERKVLLEKKKAKQKEDTGPLGPRRAAEKARSVIIDYATKLREINTHKCESCGLESDSKKEIDKHYCPKRPIKEDGEESDISIKEGDSTSETDVTEIDSDVSNEELVPVETPQHNSQPLFGGSGLSSKYPSKISKLPFTVRDSKRYIQEAAKDYFEMFDMKERLFPQWLDCKYELVPKDLLSQYMPPLEESCKVKMGNASFTTFKTFEVYMKLGYCALFTGGCIQCMSWVPALASPSPGCPNVLAAATHNAADCPRLLPTDTPAHAGLVQLWDYGDFTQPPKFAFGLAHDYGIVWDMDWCPSGAREELKEDAEVSGGRPLRLGLMAMACSNGSAYVVSVPYPDNNQIGDKIFYKIKPCVELRRSRGPNKYQATCINWCLEKGYTSVRVGYADGTTAMYDLVTESPLLKFKEGDGTVLYPFHEERIHNSCVTGLASSLQGLWCSASPTGATGSLGGARPIRVHAPLAASAAVFTPHWPSALLSGDDTIVGHSASELEWAYSGRRVGAIRAITASAARTRAAIFTPPLLVTMRPHPVFSQGNKTLEKKAIGMLDIIPLAMKRSKQSNDSLSMKVEPLTYDEAIKIYGIEYKLEKDLNKSSVLKHMSKFHDPSPERFPLADVPVIAFCSSRLYTDKIAVATHAGIIFLQHS